MRPSHAILTVLSLLILATPVVGEGWSIGVGAGPFTFGDFAQSHKSISNGETSVRSTTSLTAPVTAGVTVDLERFLTGRWSVRAESTFTHSTLAVETSVAGSDAGGVGVDIADLDTTTIALPLAYRLNDGRVRFQLFAGPAYAFYNMDPQRPSSAVPLFAGTRGRIGAEAGAGVEWTWTARFLLRLTVSDIYTRSPLDRSDFEFGAPETLEISSPHNLHVSGGVAYRF